VITIPSAYSISSSVSVIPAGAVTEKGFGKVVDGVAATCVLVAHV